MPETHRKLGIFKRLSLGWKLYRESQQRRDVYERDDYRIAHGLRLASKGLTDPGSGIVRLGLSELRGQVVLRQGTTDFLVVREIFELGCYDPMHRMNLPRDARVLDLGGNVGLAARFIDTICPQGRFVCVEPDRQNVEQLRINCQPMIDANRLTIVEGFAGATDGVAAIDRSGGAWGFRKSDSTNGDGADGVPVYSIPTLLVQHGFDRVDLLKCDVEGSEAEIFADCRSWIGRVKNLFVETHQPYTLERLYADLRSKGVAFKVIDERQRTKVGTTFLTLDG
ncbi:MAG TPA: FkbM family methyltransferase [Tepidisphaeraceae bacterium]|nr:FkbM family methyltransferase [Tepidisphaeraceae bacterium]